MSRSKNEPLEFRAHSASDLPDFVEVITCRAQPHAFNRRLAYGQRENLR